MDTLSTRHMTNGTGSEQMLRAHQEMTQPACKWCGDTARTPRLLYGIDEVAKILGISRASAYRLAASGVLPTVTLVGRMMVRWTALEAFVAGLTDTTREQGGIHGTGA